MNQPLFAPRLQHHESNATRDRTNVIVKARHCQGTTNVFAKARHCQGATLPRHGRSTGFVTRESDMESRAADGVDSQASAKRLPRECGAPAPCRRPLCSSSTSSCAGRDRRSLVESPSQEEWPRMATGPVSRMSDSTRCHQSTVGRPVDESDTGMAA